MQELEDKIYVAIRTAPKQVLAALRNPNPMAGDEAAARLARIVTEAVQRHLSGQSSPPPTCGGGA